MELGDSDARSEQVVRGEAEELGRRILLLVNRKSGRGESDLGRGLALLEEQGFSITEVAPDHPGDIPAVIDAHADAVDLVVVGGGDGSMNAALPSLMRTRLPLGILPMGTANDLARTLEIPTSLEDACAVIAARNVREIDLGFVNGKPFINDASLGLSVEVIRRAERESKRRWGVLSYAMQAFQVLRDNRPFRGVIQCDGERQRFSAVQITVGNGRYHGGGLSIAEDTRIDDGRLDLYVLEPMPLWRVLALGSAMWRGTHHIWEGIRFLRGKDITVETAWPMPVNADGEHATTTPARFWVAPRALRVLVPPQGPGP